jgi:hypothetical protein
MKEKDKPPVFIKFTPLQVKKIEVMKKSIQEPVTRKDIIDGMIDSGYVVALKTLHDAGLINKKISRSLLHRSLTTFWMRSDQKVQRTCTDLIRSTGSPHLFFVSTFTCTTPDLILPKPPLYEVMRTLRPPLLVQRIWTY